MWIPLLVVVFNFLLVEGKRGKNVLPHTKCERTWEKVGCFKDKKSRRTLPVLLVNDRDPSSEKYDGHRINWHAWEESMLSLACRCANATREREWKIFGLQFYGECWSGENGETTFNKYGNAKSSSCLQELVNPIPPCDINKDMECVGARNTNYIYRLKDLNVCAVHKPCKNGGTCVNTVGGYNCKCPANYKGKNCDEDVNECTVYKPCKNGGTCVNSDGDYNCQCPDNYKGKNCEEATLERTLMAQRLQSLHYNVWSPNGDSYTCQCTANFQGQNCDKDVNECAANPCKNGAKCTNTPGDYKCACDHRFSGKNCDQDVNECTVYKPCKNGGTCVNTVGSYNCQCPDNYKGKHCEEDVNECTVYKPCKNGGTCVNTVGSYNCQCPDNYKGKHCEEDVNECTVYKPCKNGGTCVNTVGGYNCQCPDNYKGKNCDEDVDECAVSNPCKNGGKCQNTRGGYKCACVGGFFGGKNCDQVPAECSSYSKLSDASRASSRHRENVLRCDRYDLAVGWYRFTDAAGTRMPTSPVAIHHCGTHAPGWMNGDHPSKDDGSVKRKVCFHWNNNACLWNIEISVRNCGAFYVYYLPRTPYCWLRYCGTQDHIPAECSSYSKLSDASRASSRHRGHVLRCDYYDLAVGWYRFTDAAGTKMPTSPVAIHHCGTHAPGWMNGDHPSKYDGSVKRKVCFHWSNNVCRWNIEISVRNCGAFYVYHLPKIPYCWLRYCGTEGRVPAECSSYSKLSDASRASSRHRGNVLRCDRNDLAAGWYRFTDAAGTKMPTSPVAIHHCGTHAPGWMNGDHPSKYDGSVKRKVCFHWNNNVCLWNVEISVRNCGAFYVYHLPRIPYCYLRYCGSEDRIPAECSSYFKLSDASRASSRHRGNVLRCDRYDLAVGWYRFTDAAGTKMPTSPVAINHCGTHAPGWMNGDHPSKDDGSVKRKVCFHWNNNVCLWNIEISVRNCGAFYVYHLPRIPYCYLRYCGTEGRVPAECSSYSKLSDASRDSSRHRGNVLRCDRYDLAAGWYRFTDAAGTRMPTSPVAIHHCGTHAPGWMNGDHPSKQDGSVKRKVCFHWNNNVCLWNIEISVRNCGAFYVYHLPRIPYCYLRYCGTEGRVPDECSSYSKLSDASRASTRHRGNVLRCDRYDLAAGWYRFTDAAGIRMPTSPVAIHHCGTHAPGWMNGEHPSKDVGSVKRKVCFHWNNNVCLWSIEISVRNCGAFYVYYLPRIPYCYLRYCGTEDRIPAECSSYSKLSDASRASSRHRGNVLRCDYYDLAVGWYRFTDAAGTKMPTSPVAIHHCGTHAPGWMNGDHPSKDDGSVKRKVCFHWSNNVCRWNIEISVRNCGAFYVYHFPRIPYCWLRYCGAEGRVPAECSSYSKLSDASRASSRHRGNVLRCDRYDLAAGWYRFTDAAGTRMPTSPVTIHHCGTHAPGWMNGDHPSKYDGSVKRKVCFHWNNNVCLWSIEISVRNCGAFYVYHLPRIPYCYLRYCGTEDRIPGECSSYFKLSDASRASSRHRGNVLRCDRYDLAVGWYRFTDAAGTRMPTSPVAINHCGTHAPGWMNGNHPSKDDGNVKRKVCFHWNNNVCLWNIEISVRNCGAFYVYHLPRIPYCWLRYCGK